MDKYTELPAGIRKQVKKVDQMILDIRKDKDKAESPPVVPIVEPVPEVVATPPAEPVVETPVEEPEPVVEAPAPELEKPISKEEYEKVQQELSTLKGKYNKEPAELMRQVSFLSGQIQALQAEKTTPVVEPKPEEKPKSLREIMKDDPRIRTLQESLAPEVFEGMMAVQEKIYDLASERAKETISQEVSKVDAKFAKTREERFWDDLQKSYPNWAEIRSNPEFQMFTNEIDPLTGVQRYWIIKDAFDQKDASRVIRFLDIATGKGTPPPSVDKDNGKEKVVSEKLAAKVAPARSSGPTPSPKPANTMTVDQAKKELVNLANLKNRSQWKGTDEEYKKRDIALRKIIREGSLSP